MQWSWFHKVLCDICETAVAKKIVSQNRDSKDARVVWAQLCAHDENSMSSKLCSEELLRCADTSQLANSNYHGTYQSHRTGFFETIRQHQALQTDENKLSDQICVDFSMIQWAEGHISNASLTLAAPLERHLDTPIHTTSLSKSASKDLFRQPNNMAHPWDKIVVLAAEVVISTQSLVVRVTKKTIPKMWKILKSP